MCHLLQRDLEQVRTTLQAKEARLRTLTKERDEFQETAATQNQAIEVHQVLCAHHNMVCIQWCANVQFVLILNVKKICLLQQKIKDAQQKEKDLKAELRIKRDDLETMQVLY